MDRYKQKGNDITFDGHTMFKEDILRDLNVMHRKLEDERYIKAEVIETAKREARVGVATDAYTYFTMCPDFGRPPRLTCVDDRIMVRQYLRKIINQNKGKV